MLRSRTLPSLAAVTAAALLSACALPQPPVARPMGVQPRPRVAPAQPVQVVVPGLVSVDPGTPLDSRAQDWKSASASSLAYIQSMPAGCSKPLGTVFAADMSTAAFQAYWQARVRLLQVESSPAIQAELTRFEGAMWGSDQLNGSLVFVNGALRGVEYENRMANGVNMRVETDKWIKAYSESYYAPQVYFDALGKLAKSELVPALRAYSDAHKAAVQAVSLLYQSVPPGPRQLERLRQIHKSWVKMKNQCEARSYIVRATYNTDQLRNQNLRLPPNYPAALALEIVKIDDALRADEDEVRAIHPFSPRTLAWLLLRMNGAEAAKDYYQGHNDKSSLIAAIKRGEPALIQYIAKASADAVKELAPTSYHDEVSAIARNMPATAAALRQRQVILAGLSPQDAAPMSNAEKARRNTPPSERDLLAMVTMKGMADTGAWNKAFTVNWIDESSYAFSGGPTTKGKAFSDLLGTRCTPVRGKHHCSFSVTRHIEYPVLFGTKTQAFEIREMDIVVYWTEQGLRSDDLKEWNLGFVYTPSQGGSSGGPGSRTETPVGLQIYEHWRQVREDRRNGLY